MRQMYTPILEIQTLFRINKNKKSLFFGNQIVRKTNFDQALYVKLAKACLVCSKSGIFARN